MTKIIKICLFLPLTHIAFLLFISTANAKMVLNSINLCYLANKDCDVNEFLPEAAPIPPTFDTVIISMYAFDKSKIPNISGGLTLYNGFTSPDVFQFIIANPSTQSLLNPCPAPNYSNAYYSYLKDNCPKSCDIFKDLLPNLQIPSNIVSYKSQDQGISALINNFNQIVSPPVKIAALSLNTKIIQQFVSDPNTQYIILILSKSANNFTITYQGYDKNKTATTAFSDTAPVYFTLVSPS